MAPRQVCAFHADEDVPGTRLPDGTHTFTCPRPTGHPVAGPYTWMQAPQPPDLPELTGLADELGLDVELPAAIARYPGRWVEYGVVEHAYATANPGDFARLVDRYSHTEIAGTRYSASAFLAATLGRLSGRGYVLYHHGPATGRWDYLRHQGVSWWAVTPAPDWERRISWADLGLGMGYVPGSTE